MEFTIGERRYTSAGNVFELVGLRHGKCQVRRVGLMPIEKPQLRQLWDHDITYTWSDCQWDSIPLLGERSHDPSFGIFAPQAAS